MSTETTETALGEHLEGLHRLHQGKVRDIFAIDETRMLLVATDRLSAFDVVLPQRLDGKGKILTRLSKSWFDLTADLVQNHVI